MWLSSCKPWNTDVMFSYDKLTNIVDTFMDCDYRVVHLETHTMLSDDKLNNNLNTFMACDYRVVNLETHTSCSHMISWQTL